MDRKLPINILKRDFKALIAEYPPVLQTFQNEEHIVTETEILSKKHYFYSVDGRLHKIVRTANGKKRVIFLFSETKDDLAGNIQISHKNIPLTITLYRI
jgi:pyruvate carboxylase